MLGELGWGKTATLGGLEMRANTHMGMTFSHLLPGLAGFAAAVVAPWYSADPSLIPIAIVLLLCLIISGVSILVFQRSINKKTKQVPSKGPAAESQMFQTLKQAIEEGRASLDLSAEASPNPHEEIPSPLAELALQFDTALPDPNTENIQIPRMASNGNLLAHPPANPAREETARVSLPRLSELRGMRFSQALRELDKAKRSAPPNAGPNSLNGSFNRSLNDVLAERHNDTPNSALNDLINDPVNETLMSAIAPFELMFAARTSAPEAQNGATAMHDNGAAATKDNGAQGRLPQQTFFPPKLAPPANNKGRRREDSTRSPLEPKAPEKETDGFLDQLQVLPSRRGQYKKKG